MKLKKDIRELHRRSEEAEAASQSEKELKARDRPAGRKEAKIDTNKVVLEYLLKNSFQGTLEKFQQELAAKKEDNGSKLLTRSLVSSFDAGSTKEFFDSWEKLLSEAVIDPNLRDDLAKLEFYFQVYFCIHAVHPRGLNLKVLATLTSKSRPRRSASSGRSSKTKARTSRRPPSSCLSTRFHTSRTSKNTKPSRRS